MQANQIAAQKAAPNDATPIKAKGLACLGHILKAAQEAKWHTMLASRIFCAISYLLLCETIIA